jgi:3-deoxy-D-manno-octulosonic-acid transferase
MAAAAQLSRILRADGQLFTPAFTATNAAGVEFAAYHAGGDGVVALSPWDHAGWLRRAFDAWRPRALFLVETELWPGLILEARRRGIPVCAVSARVYPRDVARYRLVRGFTARMLRRLDAMLAQSESERARFLALGAPPDRCLVAGNLKYARLEAAAAPRSSGAIGCALPEPTAYTPDGGPTVAVGSLHADEVSGVLAALDPILAGATRLVIAPRHRSAVAVIVREAQRRRWRVHCRSAGVAPPGCRLVVLDRMGELPSAYAQASVAVVGGGFAPHGGHNPLEPLIAGTPVLFGPHSGHFEDETRALTAATPEARVELSQLGDRVAAWLSNDDLRRDALERQRCALPDGAAIARRYVAVLAPLLGAAA